jgi:hypothetical protein
MVRKGGGRDPEAFLDMPDGQTCLSRTHQQTVDLQLGHVPECFELLGCLFDVHGNKIGEKITIVMRYF